MFFTQYSPVLFLTTAATTALVILMLFYTRLGAKAMIGRVSLLLAALSLTGLIKYQLVTKPISNEYIALFLNLAESCFVIMVTTWYFRLYRLRNAPAGINRWYACLFVVAIVFAIAIIDYPSRIVGIAFFWQAATVALFLPLPLLLKKRDFLKLPLLAKLVLYLAAYIALSNTIIIITSLSGKPFFLWKLDIVIYSSLFWIATMYYLRPARSGGQPATGEKTPLLIPESAIEECLLSLQIAFEKKKLYLDPELTLQSLAAEIHIPSRMISAVLNRNMQKNFNEYLNHYRVEEAKKLLQNYKDRNTTIAAVAYEAGFNSLATFQRVFKKVSGKTPREFADY